MLEQSFFDMLAKQAYQDGITAISVRAIIEHRGAMLILKRDHSGSAPDLYELPGGNVDSGESLNQALRREVKEETGLNLVDITDFVHSCDYFSPSSLTTKRLFIFEARFDAVEPIKLTEHTNFAWLDKKDVQDYAYVSGMNDILSVWWHIPVDYDSY